MIILMGVAGAGKSLQAKMFVDNMGYRWVSTGEIFRSQLNIDRKLELLSGKLIDDTEVIGLVAATLDGINDDERTLLDGFPRTIPQAQWIIDQTSIGKINVKAVFNLVISKDIVRQRLLDRARDDDNEEIIKERFHEYETKTVPIIDFFRSKNINVYDINADQSPEDVHKEMLSFINKG